MPHPTPSLADSMAVLDRIEQALGETLRLAPEVPASEPLAPPPTIPLFDQRLDQWQACLEMVEEQATRAADELDEDVADLRAWQKHVARFRETLSGRAK